MLRHMLRVIYIYCEFVQNLVVFPVTKKCFCDLHSLFMSVEMCAFLTHIYHWIYIVRNQDYSVRIFIVAHFSWFMRHKRNLGVHVPNRLYFFFLLLQSAGYLKRAKTDRLRDIFNKVRHFKFLTYKSLTDDEDHGVGAYNKCRITIKKM
jgi:hypothetical protein